MEIVVQGKGSDFFVPDEVSLNITFKAKAQTYEKVLEEGIKSVQCFVKEILLKNYFKIEDMKTRNFVIIEEKKFDSVKREYIFDGFKFNQFATLKFDYNKEKLAQMMVAISKLDNSPECRVDFRVKKEKECRKNILSKAYKDAQDQAMAIALAAGKTLIKCVKVDFKPFTTNYCSQSQFGTDIMSARKSSASAGAAQAIVNTFTPEDIILTETLYCLWIAE